MALAGETETLLSGSAALIVAAVGSDGTPFATRGWGFTVLSSEPDRVRLLLDADDAEALAHLAGGGAIAITGSDVPTLRSIQVKGRVEEFQPTTDVDRAKCDDYCDGFFGDVERADRIPRHDIERIRPFDVIACTVAVDELWDQTPGPAAGASLGEAP